MFYYYLRVLNDRNLLHGKIDWSKGVPFRRRRPRECGLTHGPNLYVAGCRRPIGTLQCSLVVSIHMGEIHHCLAEINRYKSIKRPELFPITSVQSSSRDSGETL